MAVIVNYVVQQAKAFLTGIANHAAQFAAKGFGAERTKRLEDKVADLEKKDTEQKDAEKLLGDLTDEQNNLAAQALEIIRSAQNAGQSALGKTPATDKEFMIGKIKGTNVTKLLEALRYFVGLGLKYHDQLIANGMSEEDIESIGTLYGTLTTADAKQENQKKLRNNATETRNDSEKALNDEIFRTKKFVKTAFKNDKAIQEEFKPIKRGGGGGGKKPPASSAPDQPKQ